MQFDAGWRLATKEEIATLQAEPGAPHVTFGCTCCGMVNWHSKNIALSDSGRYNGARKIFVGDWSRGECACDPAAIRCVVPDKPAEAEPR